MSSESSNLGSIYILNFWKLNIFYLKFDIETLEEALRVVQSLDPSGVGARTPQECLLLQTGDPLIQKVIREYWDAFIHQDDETVMRALGIDAETYGAVRETIRRLDLYPGRGYSQSTPIYIEPDVTVIRKGVHYTIMLNEDGMPHLRVNRNYLTLYERALEILEKALPPDHPDLATVMENMAIFYREIGKDKEAEKLEQRAREIREQRKE